ncbi:MAG: DUF799 family lipoprotein [Chlamydiota bacterium]|nr:DUF799 family lipoprotein [Chlamydiota bacterium]
MKYTHLNNIKRLPAFAVILVLVFVLGSFRADSAPVKKIKIAILPFKNSTEYVQGDIGIGLSDMLITQLIQLKRYIVFERVRIEDILQEQDFGVSGRVETSTAAQIGKIVGVDAVVLGNITQYGVEERYQAVFGETLTYLATVAIDLRIVDVETGQVMLSASANGISTRDVMFGQDPNTGQRYAVMGTTQVSPVIFSEASRYAIDDIVTKIFNLYPLEGYIVSRDPEYAVIDLGSAVSIKPDDLFNVYRIGNKIVHPVTGEVLGEEKELIGKVKVKQVMGDVLSKVLILKGTRDIKPRDRILSIPREIRSQTRQERRRRDRQR